MGSETRPHPGRQAGRAWEAFVPQTGSSVERMPGPAALRRRSSARPWKRLVGKRLKKGFNKRGRGSMPPPGGCHRLGHRPPQPKVRRRGLPWKAPCLRYRACPRRGARLRFPAPRLGLRSNRPGFRERLRGRYRVRWQGRRLGPPDRRLGRRRRHWVRRWKERNGRRHPARCRRDRLGAACPRRAAGSPPAKPEAFLPRSRFPRKPWAHRTRPGCRVLLPPRQPPGSVKPQKVKEQAAWPAPGAVGWVPSRQKPLRYLSTSPSPCAHMGTRAPTVRAGHRGSRQQHT